MTARLCFFFVFMVFWRPQDWLVPWLQGVPILDVVTFFAVMSFVMEKDEGKVRIPVEMPQINLLFGLWIAALMSHVANTYLQGFLDTFIPAFKMCFFTGLLFCVLDRPERLRNMARIYVSMSCLMTYHALLQQTRGYGFMGQPPVYQAAQDDWGEWYGIPRSQFFGIFEDPNDLAQMLAASVPFAFCLTRRRSFWSLLIGCLISWYLTKGVLATHSRGGLVGLLTGASVVVALILPSKWLPVLMVGILGAWLMICPLSAGHMDMSARDRVVFWGMANQKFKSHPIFGIGYGMFWQVADDRAAHNAFVYCYTELGFVGYWLWYTLLELGFLYAWRTRVLISNAVTPEEKWMKMFCGLSIAAMGSFAASSYFLSRAYVYPFLFLFATLGSIPIVVGRLYEGQNYDVSLVVKPKRDVFLVGIMGSAISIFYIYWSIILLNKAYG